jgi:hypothetical protein
VIKHTQKLISFAGGLCVALFLGINSASAYTYTPTVNPFPLTQTGQVGTLNVTQADFDSIGGYPLTADLNTIRITVDCPVGGNGWSVDTNYTCPSGAGSCVFPIDVPVFFPILQDGLNECYNATGTYAFGIEFQDVGLGGTYVQNVAQFTIDTPQATTSGNAILDTMMPQIVTTFIEFVTQLFTNYWPFMLVLSIVAAFIRAFEKFFNSITK